MHLCNQKFIMKCIRTRKRSYTFFLLSSFFARSRGWCEIWGGCAIWKYRKVLHFTVGERRIFLAERKALTSLFFGLLTKLNENIRTFAIFAIFLFQSMAFAGRRPACSGRMTSPSCFAWLTKYGILPIHQASLQFCDVIPICAMMLPCVSRCFLMILGWTSHAGVVLHHAWNMHFRMECISNRYNMLSPIIIFTLAMLFLCNNICLMLRFCLVHGTFFWYGFTMLLLSCSVFTWFKICVELWSVYSYYGSVSFALRLARWRG